MGIKNNLIYYIQQQKKDKKKINQKIGNKGKN